MEGSSEDSDNRSRHGHLHHTTLDLRPAEPSHLTSVFDQSQNTASLLASVDPNQTVHVIDMSAYVAPKDEQQRDELSQSICIANNHDPFDADRRTELLNRLNPPLHHYSNYYDITAPRPHVQKNSTVSLGKLNVD